MAKNREPEAKPADSEESNDKLVSESESESEQETGAASNSEQEISAPSNSDSDESLDSDASDSESLDSDPTPKKPDPSPKSKPNPISTQASAAGVKRPSGKVTAEVQDSKKAKKAEPLSKKNGKSQGDDTSKKLFERVFSEDDEIALLQGMLDFISNKKSDPLVDVDDFLDFIKKLNSLHFDVTRAQLLNKMRRLKGKYQRNASKVMNGNERKFFNKHEREGYALSKSIWGGNNNAKLSNEVDDKVIEERGDERLNGVGGGSSGVGHGVDGFYVYSALEKRVMSEEIKNVDREKQKELKKKWKEIEVTELQLFAKRSEYMAEKARLIVAAKKA